MVDLLDKEIAFLRSFTNGERFFPYTPEDPVCRMVECLSKAEPPYVSYRFDVVPGTCTVIGGIECCDDNTRYNMLVHLTRDGALLLEQLARDADERRCNARKEKNDNVQKWAIGIISSVVSSLLTLFVEHFDSVLSFLRDLFSTPAV